jgi:hypothetical protein
MDCLINRVKSKSNNLTTHQFTLHRWDTGVLVARAATHKSSAWVLYAQIKDWFEFVKTILMKLLLKTFA